MIDLVWNFPLLAGQGEQWRGYLRRALDDLHTDDARELQPTFRGADANLRERLAKFLGVDVERAWISDGGHHGTLLALLAANLAGATIATETVTYAGILDQSRLLGAKLAGCAYDGEGMTAQSLREQCELQPVAAMYTMPTVHNPLGCVASLERRQAIVAVAREFDLTIVEDDAYGFMQPDAPPNYSVLAPERTFYVRGLSKSYAPATRTGWMIVPPGRSVEMESVLKNTTTGTSLVHNLAAMSLAEDGTLAATMQAKLAEGAERNALAREILGPRCAAGSKYAWHVWVSLPEGLTAARAQQLCAERGVAVSGGHHFTVPGHAAPAAMRLGMGGEVERMRVAEGLAIVAEVLEAWGLRS